MQGSGAKTVLLFEILRWLAEGQHEAAARCSPEFGLRLMTDTALEPRPEVRAAMGRALGPLGLDSRAGVGVKDGIPEIDWVRIPGGEFLYQKGEPRRIETFYMARYAVTNAQYEAFLNAPDGYRDDRWWEGFSEPHRTPQQPRWGEPNHPMETVNWSEAMAFCGWLSHRLGYEVRLPTEWEWERAARGTDGREFPWGAEYKPGCANIDETSWFGKVGPHYLRRTSPVGIYPQGASPEGVLDLSGNVWEWCLNEYMKPERTQRSGTESRVLRGGSWYGFPAYSRADFRVLGHPSDRSSDVGFRAVCSSPIR
jgi:formylglycine-generating enzyme required for sulfatase activity